MLSSRDEISKGCILCVFRSGAILTRDVEVTRGGLNLHIFLFLTVYKENINRKWYGMEWTENGMNTEYKME